MLSVLLIPVLLATGCRPSPILEQTIYTDNASEVDTDQNQLDSSDTGTEDDQLKNKEKSDSDTLRGESDTKAVKDDSSDNSGTSAKVKYDSDSDKDSAGTTSENGGLETLGTESDDSGGSQGDNSGDQDSTGVADNSSTQKKADTITVTDADGKEVTVPKSVKKVAAVGPVASMVEMLAGDGYLVGSSSDFVSNSLAKQIFSDVKEGDVATWWSGDGDSQMDNGSVNGSKFKALLKSGIQVVFTVSGYDSFSSKQETAMTNAGITIVPIDLCSSMTGLENSVTFMGKIIGGNAKTVANNYNNWIDSTVVSDVGSKTKSENGKYSVFISDWVNTSYTLKGNYKGLPSAAGISSSGKGSGAAVAWSSSKDALISDFMKVANVTNEATADSAYGKTEEVYVTPMFNQLTPVFASSGSYAYYDDTVASSADLFVSHNITDSTYTLLGDSSFPAIIVADSSIKTKIKNSWFWENHGGVSGSVAYKAGYKNPSTGDVYYSSIIDDYNIYVNPTGVSSWAEGSVESPLEAYWIAYKFYGKYSLKNMYTYVEKFYKDYFHASLTDSQVKTILGE